MTTWFVRMKIFFEQLLIIKYRHFDFSFKAITPTCLAFIIAMAVLIPCAHAGETNNKMAPMTSSPFGEMSELWTGALYTSTYRVGVCVSANGAVRGALLLRLADGQIDEYHFSGTVKNNHIEARHSSGHQFSGRLVSRERVEGRISLKNGMNIFLEGKRSLDVPLNYDDCSPLPERVQ